MNKIITIMILIISLLVFTGCISSHYLQVTTKNNPLKTTYNAQDIFDKVQKCYYEENREILFEKPKNSNYKKIRIYEESNNFYRLIAVITIFSDKEKTIHISENLSKNLKISEWIENNMECKL
ncbi:MAG: hypothetical protein K8R39_01595 [Arcobacteraceae bacterium]|nr:hypothetical protein [Arcobacteraceae bacterium]